jgi:fatty acid/phospholipid biosynthesis enzyme
VLVGEAGGETAAGGALEGVDGIVILEHGRSYAYAFRNAPRTAGEAASSGILNAITGIPKK